MNLLQKDFSFEEAVFYCIILGPPCLQGMAILTFVESKKFAEYFEAWADFQVILCDLLLGKIPHNLGSF